MSSRIEDIYVPEEEASCQVWKNYYDRLEKAYGEENAREAWLYTWNQKGNSSCTKSEEFNRWAKARQIAVADGVDKAIAGISGIGQNIIGGVQKLTGLTPKLATALLIGGVGLSLFLAFRIAKQLKAKELLEMTPLGKTKKMQGLIGGGK